MDIYCKLLHYYGFLLNPLDNDLNSGTIGDYMWVSVAGQHLQGCGMKCIWNDKTKKLEAYQLPDLQLMFSISPADSKFSTINR